MPHRPATPPPGAPRPEELLVARFRPQARRLIWSGLLVIVLSGLGALAWGNLPAPFEDWMILAAGAGLVLLFVVVPWLMWRSHLYTVTTRRVIARSGVLGQQRSELSHARGYAIETRRGVWQRLWGTGTLTLSDGDEGKIVLANVPHPRLVGEVLADQIEVNQIIAHREAEARG